MNTREKHEKAKVLVFRKMQEDAGLEVEKLPTRQEDGAHAVVRRKGGPELRVRVAMREDSDAGNYANFKKVRIPENRENREGFFLVFYSEHEDEMWLMSAEEFDRVTGGKKGINFLGKHRGVSGTYKARDFSRLKAER